MFARLGGPQSCIIHILSSTVPEDSGTEVQVEVGSRIQAGLFRRKRVTGILYDMEVPNWVKMKDIWNNGSICNALWNGGNGDSTSHQKHELSMEVSEMRILRFSY